VKEGREEGTSSGWGVAGLWARSGRGLERSPGSIFIFISSSLFYLFFVSDLNQILCKLDSKHFKQNPKLF
jgi:hypothetical protein